MEARRAFGRAVLSLRRGRRVATSLLYEVADPGLMRVPLTALLAVLALLAIAAADAAPVRVIEDPVGDVHIGSYGNYADVPAGYAAADFVAIDVEETDDAFLWTVQVAGEPSESNSCIDQGDLRIWFRYGTIEYNIQQGQAAFGSTSCQGYAALFETYGRDFARTLIGPLNQTIEGTRFTVEVPRDWLVDETGAPPVAGREFRDIRGRSVSHYSFGGPDPTDPFSQEQGDLLVINDNIPDTAGESDEGGAFRITTGGMRHEGDLRVWSEYPFRASNGGNGVFAYDVIMENVGDTTKTVTLALGDTPTDWRSSAPQTMALGPGGRMTHTVAVETPFGHRHGGTDAFLVRIVSESGDWAEADLGIHYLETPQPAGHHPTLFIHPQLWEGQRQNPFVTAFAGGDGDIWMHATSEPPGDVAAVQGFHGFPSDDTVLWPVCLTTDLKLGLDFDMASLGAFSGRFTATKPYTGATLEGMLYHVSPGPTMQFCYEDFLVDRTLTELARIEPVDVGDITGEASVEADVTPLVDEVPFEPGATLMLYVWLEHESVSTPGGSGIRLEPGAALDLPLLEYVTDAPVGLIGGPEAVSDVSEVDDTIFEETGPDVSEDAPTAALVMLIGALAGVAVARRR